MIGGSIRRVLEVFGSHDIRCLLMGGQACVLYGAAEFSKDIDFTVLAAEDNLSRLERALLALDARPIAVPELSREHLEEGLAVHFRCHHPGADRLRIDLMSKQRGVDRFDVLWSRRTTVTIEGGLEVELLSLPDLVAAKKTQRDKDWPMIERLVEANYFAHRERPTPEQLRFWLLEMRTPELLRELVKANPAEAERLTAARPLLGTALEEGTPDALAAAIRDEEERERALDRAYWEPLKARLAELRAERRRGG